MGLLQGNFFNAFAWFGTLSAFLALTVYIVVAIASGVFYWRFAREKFGVVRHLLIPLFALALNVYVLWTSFISTLWSAPFATGSSILYFGFGVWAVALIYTIWLGSTRPDLVRQTALGLDEEPDADTGSDEQETPS